VTTCALIATARRRGNGGSTPAVFGGMAALFSAGQKGAYYDFTNLAMLAVNADGSGGAPSVGGSARWAQDLGPNTNHLRNTVSSVGVRSDGIATSGSNYGLFNMRGFGDWPVIAEPLTMVACLEILSFGSTDDRIVGSNGSGQILQGLNSGAIRLFSNYSPEVQPGLRRRFVISATWDGPRSSIAIDGDAPMQWASAGGAMDALCLGSGTGPGPCAEVHFKRLFVREGLLTALNRKGVESWAAA